MLRYLESTLSLRPKAAAKKNKMRITEKAFIYLMRIKMYSVQGVYYRFFWPNLWVKSRLLLLIRLSWSFIIYFYWRRWVSLMVIKRVGCVAYCWKWVLEIGKLVEVHVPHCIEDSYSINPITYILIFPSHLSFSNSLDSVI